MGLGAGGFEAQALFDFRPAVGEAAGVEEDDAVSVDAEVFQVSVDGENAALPGGGPGGQEAIEPELEQVKAVGASQLVEAGEKGRFDALDGFQDGKPAGPPADGDAGRGELNAARDERSALQAGLLEAVAMYVAGAVDVPNLADVRGEGKGCAG